MFSDVSPPLVKAMKGEKPESVPVWFMRQAGRSLPEYREVRQGYAMLEACLEPSVAAEITLQPVRRHKVDGAVFFSDIMVPLKLAGVDVEIQPGVGPVVAEPIRTKTDVDRIVQHRIEDDSAITEAVKLACKELATIPSGDAPWTPLLGFAGAPFTVAAYLIEGKPSRDHLAARAMMHADPQAWHRLMEWVGDLAGEFMRIQVEAGASAVQLFDSWAGSLSRPNYKTYVGPYSSRAFSHIAKYDVPAVHFGTGTSWLLQLMADVVTMQVKYPVMGIDERIGLDAAIKRVNEGRAVPLPVQGNIDPAMLAVGWDALKAHIDQILSWGRRAPGHVVNLGHGVPPTTDPEVLTRIVSYIHEQKV